MSEVTVGLLHPGEMGAAVGQCLVAAGHTVLWADGRSPASRERAEVAGLAAVPDLAELVRRADVVLSVCPPHAAVEVARRVAEAEFGGVYVDANAIAPVTAREVAWIVCGGGADYVDGGIIGTPPVTPGFIRLYLSGPLAEQVAALFGGTAADVRVIGAAVSAGAVSAGAVSAGAVSVAASAVKMAYASWTKGTAALVLAARALARADGVEDELVAEWALSQPGLDDRSVRAARSAAGKGWRWVAEMEEIAATMAEAGLPDGFHQAAAEIYRRSPGGDADLDAVLSALIER